MITGTLTRAIVITFGYVVPLPSSGALRANQSAAADRSAREDAGRRHHERLCARCHGDDGLGGELGPPIVARVALRSDEQLATLIRDGLPSAGMPGVVVTDAEL